MPAPRGLRDQRSPDRSPRVRHKVGYLRPGALIQSGRAPPGTSSVSRSSIAPKLLRRPALGLEAAVGLTTRGRRTVASA
jgi:hypothetical protein